MDRRTFLKGTAALAGATALPTVYAQAQAAPTSIRFGYAITQSGPLGPGAESSSHSQYKLWQKRVNDEGGIMLKKFGKKIPIEFVGYDDQGKPDELLKLTERLVQQDKVDMILSPYATHMNLASAPITTKYEYPVIYTTATTTKTYTLGPKWPYAFWNISQPNESTEPVVQLMGELKKAGKIKGRFAIIHPNVEYGVEMHAAFVEAAKKNGLEMVYSKGYPFGSSDLQPLVREAMAASPDAFIAMSYPPDTFMLPEQCKIVGFNPQIMYLAIGGVFPGLKDKYGDGVNGIFVYGGINPDEAGLAEYHKAHQAMFNRLSEAAALSVYGALQVTQQAIEKVGEIDRKKIRDVIASDTFKTLWGDLRYENQRNTNPWAVGQWQNGEVVGVFPANKHGARRPVFPKPAWT